MLKLMVIDFSVTYSGFLKCVIKMLPQTFEAINLIYFENYDDLTQTILVQKWMISNIQ